jgi:hypothetical protein
MPWIGYFHKMFCSDLFVLLDDVQFKKNEWQHRNRIWNPNGIQWLSVPNCYKFPQKINQVEISNLENWQKKHLHAIENSYKKAIYFSDYIAELQAFYGQTWPTLNLANIDSVKLMARLLGIKTPIEISSEYSFAGTGTTRLVNICKHFGAAGYLAGAGGHDYMDMNLFESAEIKVTFQEFTCPVYPQFYAKTTQDFIPNLSVLDLLLNCGSKSLEILKG